MGYIVFASILILVGIFTGAASLFATNGEGQYDPVPVKSILRGVAAGAFLLFGLVTVFASATTVTARAVGIQTSLGKYQATLSPGLQWTAPWSSVEEFPTQVQYLELKGDNSVAVNYQGGGKGNVDAVVRWRIDDKNAEALWRKYRTFDNVRDQLVFSAAKDSVRVVVGEYKPNDARAGENLRPITEKVQADLGKTLGTDGVKIDSLSTTGVFLDAQTQTSLEKVIAANNDIERAKADKARAIIDNETAKLREQSGSLSDGALRRYCYDVTNSWDQSKNGPLPATWNCAGGQPAGVIVGAK